MKERYPVFSRTRELLDEKIRDIETKIKETAEILAQYGSDGDRIDDPRMYEFMGRQQQLQNELSQLRSYQQGVETIDCDQLTMQTTITPGHRVEIKILEEGHEEGLTITIGSGIDGELLWEDDEFKQEGHLLVSEKSPMAQSLLGKKTGEVVVSGDSTKRREIKIIDISVSPLACRRE